MNSNSEKRRKTGNGQRAEDQDFPGYPHYPSGEDIMNPQNGADKIPGDEALANSARLSSRIMDEQPGAPTPEETGEEEDELRIVPGTEADLTAEDHRMLGDREADQDMGDDELMQDDPRVDDIGQEDDDLDIPGAELDNKEEALGEEDEENNYYSLGGDRHESLEDDPSV